MLKENFYGNCYLFFPCNIVKNFPFEDKLPKNHLNSNQEYIESFKEQFILEINSEIHEQIQRVFLEELSFFYSDNKESDTEETEKGNIFLTYHKETKLAVIVVAFFNTTMLVSHMLDRLSQNKIEIQVNEEKHDFKSYIMNKYQLQQLSNGKACLSICQNIESNLFSHYFANETFDSALMAANLKEEKFGKDTFENIAQYDSSDLYSGKNTILRIDRRDYSNQKISRIKSDIIFLFIMEILIFKESAIERTNQKIVKYISKNENVSLKKLDEITMQFSQTMPFWDIKVFNYITAQNLADKIQISFKTEEKYQNYLKNQTFLQYKVNLKQAIGQDSTSKILFAIGVIVFMFEIYNFLKDFISQTSSVEISSGILFLIILVIYNNKRGMKNIDVKTNEN